MTAGFATAAMIVGIGYSEAWERLSPPPSREENAAAYNVREREFFNEIGWWASAQLVLKTVISLENMDEIIDSEEIFRQTVEDSWRLRIYLAFPDGAKPDHSVVWDKDQREVVFDPSRGVIPVSDLFKDAGLQTYSGTLGFTAFCYQPGKPIQTLVKVENGITIPGMQNQ